MSVSIRFFLVIGVIITSCLISVYCATSVDILVDTDQSDFEINRDNPEIGKNETGRPRDRSAFARCLSTVWNWMKNKVGAVVEDDIISGDVNNVKFYLYPNPDNRDYVDEIVYGDIASLQRAHLRRGQPWKIVIHGFTNHHISEPVQQIKNAYLHRILLLRSARDGSRVAPGYNVVVIDWGMLADPKFSGDAGSLFYGFAVKNVPLVGQRVGEFVAFLLKYGAVQSLDEVHLIGFSLGSHVAGNAGNTIRKMTGLLPGRITGLDPAGPSFYEGVQFSSRQLSQEDANFVDIIHTNQGGLGIYKNIGHADFYPNGGGPIQSPCLAQYGHSQNENAVVMLNTCSHSKAPFFFSLSILRDFAACKCSSLFEYKTTCPCTDRAAFGELCDPQTRGTFYLDINE